MANALKEALAAPTASTMSARRLAAGVLFLVFLVLEEALHGVAHLARVVLFDDFALHVVFFGVAQLALVFGLFLHTVSELLIHSHQGLHAVGVEKRQHVYNLGQQFDGISVGRDGGHQRELLALGVGKAAERLGRGVGHGIAQPADVVPVAADVLQLGGQVFVEVGGAFVNLLLVLVDALLALGRKHLDVFVHFDDGQFAQFPAAEQVVLDAAANLLRRAAEVLGAEGRLLFDDGGDYLILGVLEDDARNSAKLLRLRLARVKSADKTKALRGCQQGA